MSASETLRGMPGGSRLVGLVKQFSARDTNVVVASVVLNNLLRAINSMILTRLLVPEAFGIAGVIGSVQFTVALATDLGFQVFVVRHEDGDSRRFRDTVWTVAAIRSLSLAVILAILARPLGSLFSKPELAPLIAVSSLTFVIDATTSLSLLTALRQKLILRLSTLEIIVQVAQMVASAVFAFMWHSYWAILAGLIVSGMVKSVLSYTMFEDSVSRFRLDRKTIRELWSFARYITGSSIISLVISQCDKLVLVKLMSLDHFGFYVLAGNLASAPLGFAAAYSSRVLYPTYARLWREGAGQLKSRFYDLRRLPSLLYALAAGGIIGGAPLIIGILYDHRYAFAATYLQLLGVSSLLALPSNAANETLTATGRVSATLQASIAKMIWLALAGTAGYFFYGALGLVTAVGLMEAPALALKWVWMRVVGLLDLKQELMFLAAGLMGIAGGFCATELGHWLLR